MAPLSYARFDHIDSDDDDDDAAQQRAGEQRAGKHSQSMRIIHKLLHRADPDITDAAASHLVDFITVQHRGVHPNNLRRREEIVSMLRGSRELLCKCAAERLLRLGQVCVDDKANEALGGGVEFATLLRVCTEALNTLMFALVEGVDAFAQLGSAAPDKRLLDRYSRLRYAASLITAGSPDRCSEISASVPYGDKRDDANPSAENEPSASGEGAGLLDPRMHWAVLALSTVLALALIYWRQREDSAG